MKVRKQNMRAIKKILPGQPGTKKLVDKYGEKFVCLRYRADKNAKKRFKTIELILEEKEYQPHKIIPANKVMHLRINYGEIGLGTLVKNAGGRWNKMKKYWELPYSEVKAFGLEKRIIH